MVRASRADRARSPTAATVDAWPWRLRQRSARLLLVVSLVHGLCCGCGEPALSPGAASAPAWFDPDDPLGSGLAPTFIDEFDTYSASPKFSRPTRWSNLPWFNSRVSADKSYVRDGLLVLESAYEDGEWRFGRLNSYVSKDVGWTQKYGYFEARIKTAKGGPHTRAAWWLLGKEWVDTDTHGATENDILEVYGSRPTVWHMNLYEDGQTSSRSIQSDFGDAFIAHDMHVDLSDDFHRYGMLWDPNSSNITWYFDGEPVQTAPKYPTTDNFPMFLILDNQGKDGPISPNFMYVDYVRVYQFPGEQNAGTCIGDCPGRAAVAGPSDPADRQGSSAARTVRGTGSAR